VSVLDWFFEVLSIAALIFEAYAFVDALRRPAQAFIAAGKKTKPFWLVITGVATVVGIAAAAYDVLPLGVGGILLIAAFMGAAVYLTDVKPRVREYRAGNSGSRMGPYGPW
jgi:hypothetical protein